MSKPLLIIAGPTASGKSSLSLNLAQKLNGVIICADSRQIYQDFNIGTATPSQAEMAQVPHALFDHVSPLETYTVVKYKADVTAQLEKCWQNGQLPMIVGGTGLYINSVLYDYTIPHAPPQEEFRKGLYAEEDQTPGILHQKVSQIDPQAAERIHPNDRLRLTRALEVYKLTGKPISQWQSKRSEPKYSNTKYIALNTDKPTLYERIQQRIALMFEAGLIDEIEAIKAKYGPDLALLNTLNYAEPIEYLSGNCSKEEAIEKMFIHTRQYAKRQLTWFRKVAQIEWYDISNKTQAQADIENWLEALAV